MSNQTTAYPRALPITWQQRVERILDRLYDAYAALWDICTAVAAFGALLWLINVVPHR